VFSFGGCHVHWISFVFFFNDRCTIRLTLLLFPGLGLASECIGLCTRKAELLDTYVINLKSFISVQPATVYSSHCPGLRHVTLHCVYCRIIWSKEIVCCSFGFNPQKAAEEFRSFSYLQIFNGRLYILQSRFYCIEMLPRGYIIL